MNGRIQKTIDGKRDLEMATSNANIVEFIRSGISFRPKPSAVIKANNILDGAIIRVDENMVEVKRRFTKRDYQLMRKERARNN